MDDISISEAKDRLEDLLARAARGEDVVIAAAGIGRFVLQPAGTSEKTLPLYPPRVAGQWEGIIDIPDERLLAPLTPDELSWLSGERSSAE
jgi:prevent-host-death family protein